MTESDNPLEPRRRPRPRRDKTEWGYAKQYDMWMILHEEYPETGWVAMDEPLDLEEMT